VNRTTRRVLICRLELLNPSISHTTHRTICGSQWIPHSTYAGATQPERSHTTHRTICGSQWIPHSTYAEPPNPRLLSMQARSGRQGKWLSGHTYLECGIHWLLQMVLCVEWLLLTLSAGTHWLPQMVLCVVYPSTNVRFHQVEVPARVLHYESVRVVLVVVPTKVAVVKVSKFDATANFLGYH
jgi:hypothetical protein